MSYCTSVTKNDKLFIQPAELCSLVALDHLKSKITTKTEEFTHDNSNFFSEKFKESYPDINSKFRGSNNNEYLYEYDRKKKDLCYQISDRNEWSVNCAIKYMSPLYTYDNKNKSCTLISNIELPKGFVSNKEKGQNYIYYDINENNNPDYPLYKYQKRTAYCENKWFDWIVVPNYHLGNNYEKDSGVYSKRDVRKCCKPCGKGMFPYVTNENQKICIPKTEAFDGAYIKKLDYSPLALINLIGNSEETLKDLFYVMTLEKYINFDTQQMQENKELFTKIDIDDEINNNSMPSIINTLFRHIVNKETIDIDNVENNTSIITYKNAYFNEDEEELYTLRGMANANIMNDAILVHTFLLANGYYEFITSHIKNKNLYYDNPSSENKKINYDFFVNNEFNIYRILKNKIGFIDNNRNKDENLYNIKGFNELNSIYRDEINTNNFYKYYQRLANILYKAIEVCYNNETIFSKNLIIHTKRAYANIYNIIQNKSKSIHSEFKTKYLFSSLYKNLQEETKINYNIKIPFIDIKDTDKTPIKNYIKSDGGITDEIFLNTIYNDFYNRDRNNQQIFFYTQEDNEKKNNCPSRKIPNSDINSSEKCLNCSDICNDKTKCIENKKCAIYCENEYYRYVTKANATKSERESKCGVTKTTPTAITRPNGKKIYETPIEEAGKLPDFGYLLNVFIKIIFILLTIYIAYIFYQIYGETVFTLINWLLYYLGWLLLASYFKTRSFFRWITGNTDNDNTFNRIMRDYERSNAANKYKRVISSINYLLAERQK